MELDQNEAKSQKILSLNKYNKQAQSHINIIAQKKEKLEIQSHQIQEQIEQQQQMDDSKIQSDDERKIDLKRYITTKQQVSNLNVKCGSLLKFEENIQYHVEPSGFVCVSSTDNKLKIMNYNDLSLVTTIESYKGEYLRGGIVMNRSLILLYSDKHML